MTTRTTSTHNNQPPSCQTGGWVLFHHNNQQKMGKTKDLVIRIAMENEENDQPISRNKHRNFSTRIYDLEGQSAAMRHVPDQINALTKLMKSTQETVTDQAYQITVLEGTIEKQERMIGFLLRQQYRSEFESIDGINQHPEGWDFDEWKFNNGLA